MPKRNLLSNEKVKTDLEAISDDISLLMYYISGDASKSSLTNSLSKINKLLKLEIDEFDLH